MPRLAGTDLLEETGKPVLAVQRLRLLVPADATIVGIEVAPLATHQVPLPGRLSSGKALKADTGEEITVDRLVVGAGSYPEIWGEYSGTQVRRGFCIVSLQVYPLRAIHDGNGNWTALEVLDRFGVHLLTDPNAPQPDIAHRMRFVLGERKRTETMIRRLVANPEALAGYDREDGIVVPEPTGGFQPTRTPTLSGSAVQYLIITSEALAPAFQVLADYKTAMGIPSVIATREWIQSNFRNGSDIQETMRMFIREAYQKWGTDYVLLGGDTDVLPCRYNRNTYWPPVSGLYTDIPTDLYFCCLDGNWNDDGDYLFGEPYHSPSDPGDEADLDDEVYLGRAPVNTESEAALFVNKVITYTETPANLPWTSRALWIAEALFWADGIDPVPVLDGAIFSEGIINDFQNPCTGLEYTRMYELYQDYPGSVLLNREALIDTLNTGRYHLFDQIGHGFYFNMHVNDANFTNADADALTNGDHYLVIYALNCASAAFDQNCLMERFLLNPNGGAVATLGSSRAAFPYTANDYQEEFFDHLFCSTAHRLGELISLSRAPFLPSTYYDTVHRWTYMVYCLLGDPTLSVWSGLVEPFQISGPTSLSTGQQLVNITLTRGGTPVEGALVCLAKNDDDYTRATTDATGTVNLTFTPTSPGEATLTATGHNLKHTQQAIAISTGGPYVALANLSIVDNGDNGSIGNGNGAPEAGERLALFFEVEDTGGGGASSCNATLNTNTPGVTILEDMIYVGDVPSGGLKVAEEPFLLEIDHAVTDGQPIDFDIIITSAGNTFEDQWTMTALAPEIEPVALAWEDSTHGNGNGIIEDGELIRVSLVLKNFGVGRADNVMATLRTMDPQITLVDTIVTYVDLELMQTATGSTTFSLSDADVSSLGSCWVLFEDNHGRTVRHDFQLTYPSTPGGLEADSSLGPDVIALRWLPVQNPAQRGYNVYRSLAAGGPFSRVNVDLIDGVSYYRDENLAPLTRYYYKVSAVDSSLTEGPQSVVIDQSTAPPEKSPFPLPFARDTSSHPAVGDVNGDGRPNIVLGADEVYVWTDDGGELFDGDENAQTHGPITNLNLEFQPAGIALYPLDGLPGLEIIACERQERRIHIFRWDGTELPGWPQDLGDMDISWNWATPAVGDVDGDGDPEIVVHSLDGLIWAWHHDGNELADGDGDPVTNGVFLTFPGASWGKSSPALFDLDGDGSKDIIFGTCYPEGDNQLVAYRYDRTQVAGFPYITGPGKILSSPTVVDLNHDGIWEIIIISKSNQLHVVQQDGSNYPGFPILLMAATDHTPSAAVGNFDTDDHLEIAAIATLNSLHADLYIIDTSDGTSGQPLPGWPQPVEGASEASPVVGDIDGDGTPDIVHGIGGLNEESPNNLYAFKANGEPVDGFPITLGAPLRNSPIICDLDYDGDVDIVYGSWDMLMHVWDLPFAYNRLNTPWPTFQGHFYRDGVHRTDDLVNVTEDVPGTDLFVAPPYPNPFNPSTSIRLYVPGTTGSQQQLEVKVYDLRGRRVSTLHDGTANVGWHIIVWDGRDNEGRGQASGVYFLRARSSSQSVIHKMSLVK